MQKISWGFSLFGLIAVNMAMAATPVAKVVAVVNKQVITAYDFNQRLEAVKQNYQRQSAALPDEAALKQQLLDRMVIEAVQLDYAENMGLQVTDGQLDKAIERIAESNQVTVAQMQAEITKQGQTFESFKEDIRKEILFSQLKQREVESRTQVSEAEVDAYLRKQGKQQEGAAEYQLRHILVELPEGMDEATRTAKKAKIEEALAAIKAGGDFASIAQRFSEAGDALEGGQMPWRSKTMLPTLFAEQLPSLAKGQVSGILQSENGYHVIMLQDVRTDATLDKPINKTQARHILIKVDENHSEADGKRRIEQVLLRLKQGEDFAKLAQQFSEDGSGKKGGDLGWLNQGDTVPEFETAMDALSEQALSEPVRSPFGWHIIQVLARKQEAAGPEVKRQKARIALREKKVESDYEAWLEDLRASAYVDIRSDK